MRILLCGVVMALGMAAVGCSNNECEDAMDKIDECGLDLGSDKPSDDEIDECNAEAECGAKCFNDNSCADIKAFFSSITTGTPVTNGFSNCLAGCN